MDLKTYLDDCIPDKISASKKKAWVERITRIEQCYYTYVNIVCRDNSSSEYKKPTFQEHINKWLQFKNEVETKSKYSVHY